MDTETSKKLRTSALPAIAAALALSSTAAPAQQDQPAPAQTQPAAPQTENAAPQPGALPDSTATAVDPVPSSPPATNPVLDSPTASVAVPAQRANTPHKQHSAQLSGAVAAQSVAKATTGHGTPRNMEANHKVPIRAAPITHVEITQAKPAAGLPTTSTPPARPAGTASTQVHTGSSQAATNLARRDNSTPIAVGGALALIAIGGIAVAMRRRRAEEENAWSDEEAVGADPTIDQPPSGIDSGRDLHAEQPAILAPPVSAFQWSRSGEQASGADEPLVERDDREPGETWIQRAYRGPSALNPSVSLKARLKRAAFFDKRERQAAAGLAEPVDPAAGLPERLVEEDEQAKAGEFA